MCKMYYSILRSVCAWLAILFCVNVFAADPGVTDEKIILGVVIPLTGPPSIIGKAVVSTLKVWEADVNANGGISGRKIELRIEDDGYVPQRSVQSLKKLLDVDKIFALVGASGSSQLVAMLPIIEENNIPTVNHIAINSAHFTPLRKMVFNIGATYCQDVYAGLKYLITSQKLQGSKFALIFQEDDYGTDVKCGYFQALKELGLQSTMEVGYKRGAKDFSAEVLSVQRAGANFILTGGIISETAGMLKEVAKNQMNAVRFAVYPAHLPAMLALAGPAAEGLYLADFVPPVTDTHTPGIGKLIALTYKYQSAEEVKAMNRYSLTAYVGARFLENALRACGKNLSRNCVIEKMEQTKNFSSDGIMAPLSYAPNVRQSGTRPMLLKANPAAGKFERVSDFLAVQ
ncbi:MAG: ABC transporter substrate-binding protein [Burkholderiaceae bacterium]|nr:ABC transporter substrate-binding protein [Burkholderiaceae bacterium]